MDTSTELRRNWSRNRSNIAMKCPLVMSAVSPVRPAAVTPAVANVSAVIAAAYAAAPEAPLAEAPR